MDWLKNNSDQEMGKVLHTVAYTCNPSLGPQGDSLSMTWKFCGAHGSYSLGEATCED